MIQKDHKQLQRHLQNKIKNTAIKAEAIVTKKKHKNLYAVNSTKNYASHTKGKAKHAVKNINIENVN